MVWGLSMLVAEIKSLVDGLSVGWEGEGKGEMWASGFRHEMEGGSIY